MPTRCEGPLRNDAAGQNLNHAARSQTGGYLRLAPSRAMPFFGVKLGKRVAAVSAARVERRSARGSTPHADQVQTCSIRS